MLEVRGLACVRNDHRLFADLGLLLEPGQLLLVEGRNGSGKTTLLRTLCGLMLPGEGEVRWQGESIRKLAEEYARDVLYIGHKPGIKEELTAVENLRIASVLDGYELSEQAAWQALGRIGLTGHEDLPAKMLSQGQKRRVALARLLVSKSRLWILDEPFTALDKAAVADLQTVIRDHLSRGGMVILTTHQDVALMADDIQRLHLGARGA